MAKKSYGVPYITVTFSVRYRYPVMVQVSGTGKEASAYVNVRYGYNNILLLPDNLAVGLRM
jgi:hypothetical protein